MIAQEIFDLQAKELASVGPTHLTMPIDKGYMLAAVVQAASLRLNLPETTQDFCREFVDGFCDRYREQMPTVVSVIEDAWENPQMMTPDEFEETLGEKWQRIAHDIETEMGGEVKIMVDCHESGKPLNAYDIKVIGDYVATLRHPHDPIHSDFFELCQGIYNDLDDDLEDRCASGFTN